MARTNLGGIIVTKEKVQEKPRFNPNELIFALDIGTRTVVGIVGKEEKGKFKVINIEIAEHKTRSMFDGQVHDISLVTEVVSEVKERLEKKLGIKLTKVAIAAAGRVLKTQMVKIEKELGSIREITQDIVASLELEGVQLAQSRLESSADYDQKSVFYCVGYSVTSYYLNGYVISSLVGHRGVSIGAEILATFLPHVVVDSLYSVMNRVGLEVVYLTLEPIAAINVAIPQNLRLINLALVDVGAGTSDIAITKDGAVIAYTMVPIAGDEITEKIVHHYLVDFNTAEKIKLSLNDNKTEMVEFVDILGYKRQVNKKEIYEVIKESVMQLGAIIAEKILEYNKKAPNAVFCVGGGSQIKGLTEAIAEKLGLPSERVVVKGRDIIQPLICSIKKLMGPEAITPLGIAISALQHKEADFFTVTLNGKKVRLFNSKQLTVSDALVMVGFNPRELIGRAGRSITIELNGEKRVFKGEHGKPAVIMVNGELASITTPLKPGDNIEITPAVDGKSPKIRLDELIDLTPKKVIYNQTEIDITPRVTLNGKSVDKNVIIRDGDRIDYSIIKTIEDFCRSLDINPDEFKILVNYQEVDKDYILKDGDRIELYEKTLTYLNNDLEDIIEEDEEAYQTGLNIVDKGYKPYNKTINVFVNGKNVQLSDKSEYLFVDIFRSIEFDLSKVKGGVDIRLNGKKASYTDKISNGDVIEIIWDKN